VPGRSVHELVVGLDVEPAGLEHAGDPVDQADRIGAVHEDDLAGYRRGE